ncbi:hypothetical protein [Pontimicrobium sp. MEBiC06410]|jgi:GMP synthase PP-ATPase subunit
MDFIINKLLNEQKLIEFFSDFFNIAQKSIFRLLEAEDSSLMTFTYVKSQGDFKLILSIYVDEKYFKKYTDITIAKSISKKFDVKILIDDGEVFANSYLLINKDEEPVKIFLKDFDDENLNITIDTK